MSWPDWTGEAVAGVVSAVGGGGLMAWRGARRDAGKLALEIARDADKKADEAIRQLDEIKRRAILHFPWDVKAANAIRALGGEISDPPPIL